MSRPNRPNPPAVRFGGRQGETLSSLNQIPHSALSTPHFGGLPLDLSEQRRANADFQRNPITEMRIIQSFQCFYRRQNPPLSPPESNRMDFSAAGRAGSPRHAVFRLRPICGRLRICGDDARTTFQMSKIFKATSSVTSRARLRPFCLLGRTAASHTIVLCQIETRLPLHHRNRRRRRGANSQINYK